MPNHISLCALSPFNKSKALLCRRMWISIYAYAMKKMKHKKKTTQQQHEKWKKASKLIHTLIVGCCFSWLFSLFNGKKCSSKWMPNNNNNSHNNWRIQCQSQFEYSIFLYLLYLYELHNGIISIENSLMRGVYHSFDFTYMSTYERYTPETWKHTNTHILSIVYTLIHSFSIVLFAYRFFVRVVFVRFVYALATAVSRSLWPKQLSKRMKGSTSIWTDCT